MCCALPYAQRIAAAVSTVASLPGDVFQLHISNPSDLLSVLCMVHGCATDCVRFEQFERRTSSRRQNNLNNTPDMSLLAAPCPFLNAAKKLGT